MAYRLEKETGDIVLDGWEQGVGVSPHKGIGLMQGVNIATEAGEVMCNYSRTQQSQAAITSGTDALSMATTSILAVNSAITGGVVVRTGSWINVSGSSLTGLSNGNYYVIGQNGSPTNSFIQLSTAYSTSSTDIITGYSGAGTASFSLLFTMSTPVQSQTEKYVDTSGVVQYRYYVLDVNGRVFVHDSATLSGVDTPYWFLPNTSSMTSYGSAAGDTVAKGLGLINGFLFIFGGNGIYCTSTVRLKAGPTIFSAGRMMSLSSFPYNHFGFTGHQGKLYYTDGNYLGSIFPNTALDATTGVTVNIQSYCSFTAVTTTGTITAIMSGSAPTPTTTGTPSRIPAFFFTEDSGTQPTNLTSGTKYYIQYDTSNTGKFSVYAAATGGAAIDIASGAAGIQYFNTFYPMSGDGNSVMTFTPQRLNLPASEITTTMAELGNQVVIGTLSNVVYPWNQVDVTPGDLIPLPESNVSSMITVNNMVYIFAGFKGNIYVTNGSTASLALTVPDYASGIIEPYFVWGGAMYLRGRVWFGVQDQTTSHTGQCGGIWSFVPTQNFFIGQDTGLSLRMDNRYTNFNGRAALLIANQDQQARGPQYWDVRISSVSSPVYSINYSNTAPSTTTPAIIQTDIIPIATMLQKRTLSQIEYKLSAPLDTSGSADSVSMSYRANLSDAFTSCGTVVQDSTSALSGYFQANFQGVQWIQLQATLNSSGADTTSFTRLKEIRLR